MKILPWILISTLLFLISVVMIRPYFGPTLQSELEAVNKENAELKAERDALAAEIDALKAEVTEKTQQAEALREQLANGEVLEKELENLQKQIAKSKVQPKVRKKSSVAKSTAPVYELIRKAPLFRNLTEESEVLMHLDPGFKVRVEQVVFERWLKVLYSGNNPPGYIRREDAVLVSR